MFGNDDVIDSYSAATTTDEISVDGSLQKSCRRGLRTVLSFLIFFQMSNNY